MQIGLKSFQTVVRQPVGASLMMVLIPILYLVGLDKDESDSEESVNGTVDVSGIK